MVASSASSLDLSDSTLHSARFALCELLSSSGITSKKWFWYAEVGIYGNREEWWPLFGANYRREDGKSKKRSFDYVRSKNGKGQLDWPTFYFDYYSFTIKDNVLSVVKAVKQQFESAEEHTSPLPFFAVFNSSETSPTAELQNTLIARAKMISRLSAGRYQTLPGRQQELEMSRAAKKKQVAGSVESYTNYVNEVMNRVFQLTPRIKGGLYPQEAWLYAIPIYEMRNGRPLMLATFIIIVEASAGGLECDESDCRFREVEQCLIGLELQATHLLSHRFYHDVDGYVPGSDPVVLLAHPSLCKKMNVQELRMEGVDEHDQPGFKQHFEKTGSVLPRAYERSCERPQEMNRQDSPEIRSSLRAALGEQEDMVTREEKKPKSDRAFSWLKPLYAHQRSRAHLPYEPSSNGEYHHNWLDLVSLCELIRRIELPSLVGESRRFAQVHLYPHFNGDPEMPLFHWPVEPGIRLLIPWLHLMQNVIKTIPTDQLHVLLISGSAHKWENSSWSRAGEGLDSGVIDEWLSLRDTGQTRPNGLVAAIHCPCQEEPDQKAIARMARGWTRALIDPLRRRGADTTLFRNLLLGDLGAAMSARGLIFPSSDPLFQPLEASMPIDVDISASVDELLVAVTWRARLRQGNAKKRKPETNDAAKEMSL